MNCVSGKSEVIYDSFCINEQKLYLRTFHKLLDRITGIFLLDYALIDDEKSLEYYDKMFRSWLKFLEANLPPDLKRQRYKILKKMIINHKTKDPLMSKSLLEEFLDDKSKIYLRLYNLTDVTDLKKIPDGMLDFRKAKLNPADLIYNCLHYDLFGAIDPDIKCRDKDSGLDKKRFIQKRRFELKNRPFYGEVIDFLITDVYLLFDPDYQRRGKRGRVKKLTSLPTNPILYELLPQKSKSYHGLLKNFNNFFKQNHCLSGVLSIKKQNPNGSSEFLDFKDFLVPYVTLQGFKYQEVSYAKDDIKILRIIERDSISLFLSLTGLKNSLGFCDEVLRIEFSYCLTIARNRLNNLIRRIDNLFNLN